MNATHEDWRPVVGWEGTYEVSNLGRVRSIERLIPASRGNGYRRMRSVVLRPWIHSFGYHTVRLKTFEKMATCYVHTLVLTAFREPCPEGMVCCHNDGNPANNHVDNLRWDTQAENMLDKIRHGNDHLASRTHCQWDHEYTPENTYRRPDGGRKCRRCEERRTAKRRAARLAKRRAETSCGSG